MSRDKRCRLWYGLYWHSLLGRFSRMKSKILLRTCFCLLTAVLLMVPVRAVVAQTLVNGSFELGANPGDSVLVYSGDSTTIPGWTVTSGSVDLVGTHWPAADGSRSIYLSGDDAGTLSQTI